LYIGCAGGADTHATFAVTREDALAGTVPVRISVRGLRGGHSGVDIHENRGNALKFVLRTLNAIRQKGIEFGIVSIAGGSKHNAIPREADAELRVAAASEGAVQAVVAEYARVLKEEFGEIDPSQRIECVTLQDQESNRKVWIRFDNERVLDAMLACPHGVLAMSRAVPGLVETSNNLAVVTTEGIRSR